MKLSKISLIATVLGGVLACTSIASAQDAGTNAPGGKKGKRGPSVERQLERLSTDLNLTDDQKPKVKAALEKRYQTMRDSRDLDQSERQEKMKAANEDMTKTMKATLKPDQFDKWQEIEKEMRAKKGKKGGGAPGGPGGDNTKQ